MELGNLVCLLSPPEYGEEVIKNHPGSISIIGYEQYSLIKHYGNIERVKLYDKNAQYGSNDVLLIMMCLPGVKDHIRGKFTRVIYFFDDMDEEKSRRREYKENFSKVNIFVSPRREIAEAFNATGIKNSYYIPWSMMPLQIKIVKTDKPSVFIDMDERSFTAASIERGYNLAQILLAMDINVYVFEKFRDVCPQHMRDFVNFISPMPRKEFLIFLSGMWFYASGIRGSYEYSVMESALLGCGLISIENSVIHEHLGRSCCLFYNEQETFQKLLVQAIESFEPQQLIAAVDKI